MTAARPCRSAVTSSAPESRTAAETCRAPRLQLLEEPEALLGDRQGDHAGGSARLDPSLRLIGSLPSYGSWVIGRRVEHAAEAAPEAPDGRLGRNKASAMQIGRPEAQAARAARSGWKQTRHRPGPSVGSSSSKRADKQSREGAARDVRGIVSPESLPVGQRPSRPPQRAGRIVADDRMRRAQHPAFGEQDILALAKAPDRIVEGEAVGRRIVHDDRPGLDRVRGRGCPARWWRRRSEWRHRSHSGTSARASTTST